MTTPCPHHRYDVQDAEGYWLCIFCGARVGDAEPSVQPWRRPAVFDVDGRSLLTSARRNLPKGTA